MELEIKHLAGYLPYVVKMYGENGITTLCAISNQRGFQIKALDRFGRVEHVSLFKNKIILHPLSDLINEIEINGEKFVPIIELAKLFFKNIAEYKVTHFEKPRYNHGYVVNCCFLNNSNRYAYFSVKKDIPKNPFEVVQKLIKWHFDIYGLIDAGLAVDIKTLDVPS
jgi:hypothetical protein